MTQNFPSPQSLSGLVRKTGAFTFQPVYEVHAALRVHLLDTRQFIESNDSFVGFKKPVRGITRAIKQQSIVGNIDPCISKISQMLGHLEDAPDDQLGKIFWQSREIRIQAAEAALAVIKGTDEDKALEVCGFLFGKLDIIEKTREHPITQSQSQRLRNVKREISGFLISVGIPLTIPYAQPQIL